MYGISLISYNYKERLKKRFQKFIFGVCTVYILIFVDLV